MPIHRPTLAPIAPLAWRGCPPWSDSIRVHCRDVITTFRDTVRSHAGGLNRLNVYPVPDGDTGTNMARTLDAVVAEMETAPEGDLDATCDAISHGSLMGARGNSGVILSQILRGLASTMKQGAETGGHRVAEALTAASAGAYQAVLKPIEGTILTVVRESAEAAKAASAEGASLVEVLHAARAAGKLALDNTPELLPVLKDAGVVDAGGAGYLLLLDSALYVVDGSPLPEPDSESTEYGLGPTGVQFSAVAHRTSGVAGELDVSEQRYEVMYFLDLPDDRIEAFKQGWGAIGDSIVVVGGDGLWNCHVHTNDIGAAVEVALDLDGRPKTDPGDRPLRGGRRRAGPARACAPRGRSRWQAVAAPRAWPPAPVPGSRRSPPQWSRCAAATGSPSCSRTSACRASSAAGRRSTRRRPSCSTWSSTSTPTR